MLSAPKLWTLALLSALTLCPTAAFISTPAPRPVTGFGTRPSNVPAARQPLSLVLCPLAFRGLPARIPRGLRKPLFSFGPSALLSNPSAPQPVVVAFTPLRPEVYALDSAASSSTTTLNMAPQDSKPRQEVSLVMVDSGVCLEHFKDLVKEWTQLLAEVGCDVGSFQDLDKELSQLPGRYSPAQGGRLMVAYLASSPHANQGTLWKNVELQGAEAVAADEEGPLGCVAYKQLSEGVCEMKRLFVRKQHRKCGLGKVLAEAMVIEASTNDNYHTMKLDSLERLPGARNVFYSLGFKECEQYVPNPEPDALYFERILK